MADTLKIKDGQGLVKDFAATTFDGKSVAYHAISEITGTAITDIQNQISTISSSLAAIQNSGLSVTAAKATAASISGSAYTAYSTSTTIASNISRKNLIISNQTDAKLLISLSGSASSTNFTHLIDPSGYYEAASTDVCLAHYFVLSGSATAGRVQITTTT